MRKDGWNSMTEDVSNLPFFFFTLEITPKLSGKIFVLDDVEKRTCTLLDYANTRKPNNNRSVFPYRLGSELALCPLFFFLSFSLKIEIVKKKRKYQADLSESVRLKRRKEREIEKKKRKKIRKQPDGAG